MVEYNGEQDDKTREQQLQKCEIQTPNPDTTNDSICSNHYKSVSRNNNQDQDKNNDNKDQEEEVTYKETNTDKNNDGRNGGASEVKVKK